MKNKSQFDDGPAPTGDPRIDLSKVLFVYGGKTVPGAKLAELLGMCPPAPTETTEPEGAMRPEQTVGAAGD
jgi:hypothetical protein